MKFDELITRSDLKLFQKLEKSNDYEMLMISYKKFLIYYDKFGGIRAFGLDRLFLKSVPIGSDLFSRFLNHSDIPTTIRVSLGLTPLSVPERISGFSAFLFLRSGETPPRVARTARRPSPGGDGENRFAGVGSAVVAHQDGPAKRSRQPGGTTQRPAAEDPSGVLIERLIGAWLLAACRSMSFFLYL